MRCYHAKNSEIQMEEIDSAEENLFHSGVDHSFFFVHDMLEMMFLAHPTETLVYRIREERYDPPLKTRIEAVTEDISREPAAISVEAGWLSPLPLHHLKKREHYLVFIQRNTHGAKTFIIICINVCPLDRFQINL